MDNNNVNAAESAFTQVRFSFLSPHCLNASFLALFRGSGRTAATFLTLSLLSSSLCSLIDPLAPTSLSSQLFSLRYISLSSLLLPLTLLPSSFHQSSCHMSLSPSSLPPCDPSLPSCQSLLFLAAQWPGQPGAPGLQAARVMTGNTGPHTLSGSMWRSACHTCPQLHCAHTHAHVHTHTNAMMHYVWITDRQPWP